MNNTRLNMALIKASERGEIEEINSLLEQGADINYQNREGVTPLNAAILHGLNQKKKQDTIKLLLDMGGDPNIGNKTVDYPLCNLMESMIYLYSGSRQEARDIKSHVFNMLINNGAKAKQCSLEAIVKVMELKTSINLIKDSIIKLIKGELKNQINTVIPYDNKTTLLKASYNQLYGLSFMGTSAIDEMKAHNEIISTLLKNGAETNVLSKADRMNVALFTILAPTSTSDDNPKRVFTENSAKNYRHISEFKILDKTSTNDLDKFNLLHRITESSYIYSPKMKYKFLYLLERGVNINKRDTKDKTPLELSAKNGMLDYTKILLAREDIEITDNAINKIASQANKRQEWAELLKQVMILY